MPEIVTCPKCSRKLRVPDDLLGKKVKCPECKEPFLAQTEAVNKGDDEPDETPSRKSGRAQGVSTGPRGAKDDRAPTPSFRRNEEEDEDHPSLPQDEIDDDYRDERPTGKTSARVGWGRVRLGLNLMIWGIYTVIAGFVILLLCGVLAGILALIGGAGIFSALTASSPNASNSAGAGAGAALIAAVVVLFVGYGIFLLANLAKLILDGIGHVFFLWIPDRSGTGRRPLAITALSLWGAQLVLPFVGYGLQCAGLMSRNSSAMTVLGLAANCTTLISALCGLAWFFVFMFFLRAVALGVGQSGHARTIVIYMITVPVWFVLAILSLIAVVCVGGVAAAGLASKSSSAGTAAGLGTGYLVAIITVYGIVVLITIALWIWYVVILHKSRGGVSRRLAR